MKRTHRIIACLGFAVCVAASPLFGQGVALRGVSAVNEGMAGVATATPVDSVGSIHWNPASISAYEKSDMSFGTAIIIADSQIASRVGGMEGSDYGTTGAVPAPYMGLIMKDPCSPITYGFGLLSVGGAQSNYRGGSATNPILNSATGIGATSAKVELFQLVPTASVQVTERLSVGLAPTIMIGRLIAEPMFFGPKHATTGEWGRGSGTRYAWGAGFQVGLFYKADNHFNYGFCYKSPQWMEKIPYNINYSDGTSTSETFELDYPSIYSFGVSYDGVPCSIIGVDVRYFDYAGAKGFKGHGYDAEGRAHGLGWNSIFAVSVGAQRKLTEKMTARAGYSFNENPITGDTVMSNIPCPLIMQHGLHLGATIEFRPDWFASIGYAHMFKNSVEGKNPYWAADPNNYVRSTAVADSISMGVNKSF